LCPLVEIVRDTGRLRPWCSSRSWQTLKHVWR
jgi:hypothetical protein